MSVCMGRTFTFRILRSMMKTMFTKCLLFLLTITRIDGSGIPWRPENLSPSERTMETILESCYKNDSSSSPIVIIGDYHGRAYGLSIIRLNHSFKVQKYSVRREFQRVPASKVIIIGKSARQVSRSIRRLSDGTIWWNRAAHFFILAQNHKACKNVGTFLFDSIDLFIPNVIYICTASTNESSLMSMNGIGNYAPYPWEKFRTGIGNYHVFYQRFNPQRSCTNLMYDKTTVLNGFGIRLIRLAGRSEFQKKPRKRYLIDFSKDEASFSFEDKVMQAIILKLNATAFMEVVGDIDSMFNRCLDGSGDIAFESVQLFWHYGISCLFPFSNSEIVAIVKLNREVSTLEKIRHLWNTQVLILAAVALAILFLILAIMNHDLSLALLNLTTLLIYSSLLRISERHSFRVYFTTMLMFMVISNGVFQGKIAAFLTTRERKPAIRTIDELVRLDYTIYTLPHMSRIIMQSCPKCKVRTVPGLACLDYVLNSTRHACALLKDDYEGHFSNLSLDQVEEPFSIPPGSTFCHYTEWPLANSASRIIMRLVESGLTNFWNERQTYEARQKRKETESEWFSTNYRPVKLYKLDFAFYGLALGLLISTIVFVLELLVARIVEFSGKRVIIPIA